MLEYEFKYIKGKVKEVDKDYEMLIGLLNVNCKGLIDELCENELIWGCSDLLMKWFMALRNAKVRPS